MSTPLAKSAHIPVLIVRSSTLQRREGGRRLLFATDGSPQSSIATQVGLQLADPHSELRAIYVLDRAIRLTDLVPITGLEQAFAQEGRLALKQARILLRQASAHTSAALLSTEIAGDDAAHAIDSEAQRWDADMIVVESHGRNCIGRWILGSVAMRLARASSRPLLIVHAHERPVTESTGSSPNLGMMISG